MTSYWCELAWLGDRAGAVAGGVVVDVDGDRIGGVVAGVTQPPAGTERLAGLTVPGFANAHSHAFHRALRGRTHGESGSFWTWRDRMYELAARLDPESYRSLAAATFGEMVLAGFTCVGEFHYLHHGPDGRRYADANEMGHALRDAASAAGVRLTLLDTCYLHGGFGTAPAGVQTRFADEDADAWAARAGAIATSPTMCLGAAIHSVRAVDPPAIETVAAWAAGRGAPLHAHASEQPAENEQCLAAHGRTPIALLATHGALDARFTAVHATHASADDVATLSAAGALCCLCPTTERDLADGVGPSAALARTGVAICLGTDSHALIDPFEEARAVELDERLSSLRRGTHRPGALLAMASEVGYRSLGWREGGRIEPGALADLTSIRLDSPRLAGADPDVAAAAVVFAAAAGDVHHVIVGGRAVVRDGAHATLDVAGELARSIHRVWA